MKHTSWGRCGGCPRRRGSGVFIIKGRSVKRPFIINTPRRGRHPPYIKESGCIKDGIGGFSVGARHDVVRLHDHRTGL